MNGIIFNFVLVVVYDLFGVILNGSLMFLIHFSPVHQPEAWRVIT